MNIEEIKQLIEEHDPDAYLEEITSTSVIYYLETSLGEVTFAVPICSLQEGQLLRRCESSKKLLKWIQNEIKL